MTSLLPPAKVQFSDTAGNPLAGGSVAFYIPGTSTFKTTWQDAGQVTPNANPLPLDAAGEAIIFGSGQYRQVVKDASGNLIWDQITMELTPQLLGTSTTSNTIGTGSLTWTTQSGLAFSVGQFALVVDSSNPANYCLGQITSYSGTSMTVNVTTTGGSGTKTSWNIVLGGGVGPTGPAPVFSGTSTTSQTPGSGSMTFTTQSGLSFAAGQFVSIISSGVPSAYMLANVTSYSGTTLVVNVVTYSGSGSHTDWNIALTGNPASPTVKIIPVAIVTNASDITLSAAPTQTNVGSTFTATIPTKGFVTLDFTGQVYAVNGNSLVLGLRIGGTNYWPTQIDGGPTTQYYGTYAATYSATTTVNAVGVTTSGSYYAGGSATVKFGIQELSIPTGSQTIQIVATYSGSTPVTIKGTGATSRIYVTTMDYS